MTGGKSKDRAAIVATAIIQTIVVALLARLDDPNASLVAVRPEIETLLRDEFYENARQARDDIPPVDNEVYDDAVSAPAPSGNTPKGTEHEES
jgi:hypothetical protein